MNDDLQKIVGKNLKKLRVKKKLTQKEVAIALSTNQSRISEYEQGKYLKRIVFLKRLAKFYNVKVQSLFL
ncbi:MAG: helix-turn-helix domain-containing protein [Candidatus Hodarchaeota archaeon]